MAIHFCLFTILLTSTCIETGACYAQNSPTDHQSIFSVPQNSYCIQDRDGASFSIEAANSLTELHHIDSIIKLDYRINLEETDESKSCIKGLAFDENCTRSQVFSLKKDTSVIGVATLFIKPYKNFKKHLYFKRVGNELIVQSLSDIYNENPPRFLIKIGALHILPEYRHLGLGIGIITRILVPFIKELVQIAPTSTLVLCSADGDSQHIPLEYFQTRFYNYLLKDTVHIPITKTLEPFLGAVKPISTFTPYMAKKMGLNKLEGIYNFTFGPVFAQVYEKKDPPRNYIEIISRTI